MKTEENSESLCIKAPAFASTGSESVYKRCHRLNWITVFVVYTFNKYKIHHTDN